MIREMLSLVTDPIRRRLAARRARQQELHTKVETFLRRVKKDLKKKKMVGSSFTPAGELPESYVPLPREEEHWIDLDDGARVLLSDVMEYYARHYRWNPLSNDEDVSFYGRTQEETDRFWKGYTQQKAIEFYKESMETHRASNVDLFDHFGMNDED